MRRYSDEDLLDVVIVGCGAGGAALLQRVARAGWTAAALDAGPFWGPDADWVSDELGSHRLYWTEPRVIAGDDPVPLGSNNSGRGVGGSMVHYAGYTPRFHPSDLHTFSLNGVGADWPIRYDDLRPYYQALEQELPVSGQPWPWGDPHTYPYHAQPVGGNGEIFLRRAAAAGIAARVGPVAIANGRFGNRDHCIYRGFCLQGCKVNAKASPLISHVSDALAHGGEVRANCMVTKVVLDRDGRTSGVVYLRRGVEHFQRAQMVAVAGYSIETPRLLLLSACERFPDGLCNDFGQVGRYVMVQGAPQTAGRFEQEVCMYKAPPPEVSSEQFYETDPTQDYRRGYSIQNVAPLPITLRRACDRPGTLGLGVAGVRSRLRPLGHPRRPLRVPAPLRQPRRPGPAHRSPRTSGREVFLQSVRQRPPAAAGAKAVIDSTLAGVVWGDDPMDVAALNEAMARACRNRAGPGWSPVRSRPWISRCGTSRPVCSTCRWPTCSGGPWCPYPSRRCHWSLGKQASSAATPATLASSRIVAPQVRSSATGGMA